MYSYVTILIALVGKILINTGVNPDHNRIKDLSKGCPFIIVLKLSIILLFVLVIIFVLKESIGKRILHVITLEIPPDKK